MTEQASEGAAAARGPSGPGFGKSRAVVAACMGGLLTAIVLAFVVARQPSVGENARLSMVSPADIAGAATTLAPAGSADLVAQAKQCTVPLASLTIWKAAGSDGGTVRIRSGSYVSPAFVLTDAPQRIAIPFPAPYPSGQGQISVEGDAKGVVVSLYPAWQIDSLTGSTLRNVVWKPGRPC